MYLNPIGTDCHTYREKDFVWIIFNHEFYIHSMFNFTTDSGWQILLYNMVARLALYYALHGRKEVEY